MTRILIPRSDNTSAKTIEASDWEKYFNSPIMYDFVVCGLDISAQCPNILAVDVAAGNARVKGLHLNNSVSCAVTCLTACATNKIYMTVCRDPSCEPEAWTFGSTTGCIPIDSYQIATATTNCATVTAVCNVGARVTNNQFGFVGTGAEITALSDTYVGMEVFSTTSTCGFGAGQKYVRDVCNTVWEAEINPYGSGEDGCATNPVLSANSVKSYTCLCITCNTIWGACGTGAIIVRVSGTLNIASCTTLTLDADEVLYNCTPSGGAGGNTNINRAGGGGAPGLARASVIIMANTITGTGTITYTGNVGGVGVSGDSCGSGPPSPASGTKGDDGNLGETIGSKIITPLPTGGEGGHFPSGGNTGDGGIGGGTCEGIGSYYGFGNLLSKFEPGAGGGGGEPGGGAATRGGGGGGGGGTTFSSGGAGGDGGNACTANGAGGGGGGGGSGVNLILITNTITAITVNVTGGAGGAGGCAGGSANSSGGGGGGGGGASLLLVAAADNTVGTTAGGAGGAAGAGLGSGAAGSAGTAGGTNDLFLTTKDWFNILKRGF